MAIREILKYPDPRLKRIAAPVAKITQETRDLIRDLVDTMYAAPGVGLAAPQIGVLQRVIVLDIDTENPRKELLKLVNPEIQESAGKLVWEEGCLSVVDFTAEVERASWVTVTALNDEGREMTIDAEGLLAVALQHEIDHLDGTLFVDRISRLKRDLYRRKLKKLARTGKSPGESPRLMI
jgi:peptide deformylase